MATLKQCDMCKEVHKDWSKFWSMYRELQIFEGVESAKGFEKMGDYCPACFEKIKNLLTKP